MKHGIARTTLIAAVVLLAGTSACVKREFNQARLVPQPTSSVINQSSPVAKININTATAGELEKLPGIGKALAARIVEHREKFGPFRKPEHLIIVRGISDKRFRALHDLITVD